MDTPQEQWEWHRGKEIFDNAWRRGFVVGVIVGTIASNIVVLIIHWGG